MGRGDRTRPALVLVGGAPASGKTTLATVLARTIGLPLLAKDDVKETLLDALGATDRARSREIGAASYAVLFSVAARLLDAGVGAVLESNWRRGVPEPDLEPLVAAAGPGTVLVHCQAGRDEIARRYRARWADGARHPGHHDDAASASVLTDLDAGRYAPLDLGSHVRILVVDTTAGYAPTLDTILATIRGASGRAR